MLWSSITLLEGIDETPSDGVVRVSIRHRLNDRFRIGARPSDVSGTAVTKTTGKPLTGASKTSFIDKCMRSTCESKAIDKNGKKLAGAAKNSFMAKCSKGG